MRPRIAKSESYYAPRMSSNSATSLKPPDTPWIGGSRWNPLRVDWSKGPRGTWRKHSAAGRPATGTTTWATLLTDPGNVGEGVYALHRSTGTVYIGRASATAAGPQLNVRMKAHWQTDKLRNRWNTFTWIARNPNSAHPAAPLTVDFIELIAIRLANPVDNGQIPKLDNEITWLEQVFDVVPDQLEVAERTFLLE